MSGALASPNCYEFWNIRHYKHEKSDSQASKSRKEGSEKVKKSIRGREKGPVPFRTEPKRSYRQPTTTCLRLPAC